MKQLLLLSFALLIFVLPAEAQRRQKKNKAKTRTNLETKAFDESQFAPMKWRNIGPYRGGRSVAISGVIGDPLTYYMGTVGGGVWKTTDAGTSWKNISDGQLETASVGAIELAPSDQNVIYVGMGEHPVRGVMASRGDGMYRSTDGGETWSHIGLPESHHIAEICIHPNNPDIVYVAVQGHLYGPNEDRGVYKSMDGGASWKKVLYINANTGAADLSMDPSNPRILYAGMWDHQRTPWQIRSGGSGSGIWKSTDDGDTWQKLQGGLPGEMGKVAVDVSPANPQVVYANIEAENGGVYRSNNGGKTWTQTTHARVTIARAWYYIEIFADPQNENVVYVLNAPILKSIDGGKTFKMIRNLHGDQHDLWINPDNTQNIANSSDGGGSISFNGGVTWSTLDNQPTAQFYRVITDDRYPYFLYAGQQDNSTVAISSQTSGGGIGVRDWYPVAGGESAFIAFTDPADPQKVFGTTIQGFIDVWDADTKMAKDIQPYPEPKLGTNPNQQKYRFNWNPPLVSSKVHPQTLYFGGNVIFKSVDEGQNWTEISGDLTRNDSTKHGPGSIPFTNEAAGGEVYNSMAYIATSPHEAGVIWTGSDCGLIHVTQDEGKSWSHVTPPNLRNQESLINAIEVSPSNPAKAYAAVTRYKWDDDTPMIYITEDYGKTWREQSQGIPRDVFVRVVREDTAHPDILYAGTERGLYISLDAGRNWQSFQSNLPITPITDLILKDNDLIAATAGRSFWILDDLTPLQESKGEHSKTIKIYPPSATYQYTVSNSRASNAGKNPPAGVLINYSLPQDWTDTSDLTLDILDAKGAVIRTLTNKKDKGFTSWYGGPPAPKTIPSKAGLNRATWDMRRETLPGVQGVHAFGSYAGSRVPPGTYTLRLSSGDDTSETTCKIMGHPHIDVAQADYNEQQLLLRQAEDAVRDIHGQVNRLRKVKKQLASMMEILKEVDDVDDLKEKGESVEKSITAWEEHLIQPKNETFQDVINFESKLNSDFLIVKDILDDLDPRPTGGAKLRLEESLDEWKKQRTELDRIISEEVGGFNEMYASKNLPALILPKVSKTDEP